MEELVSFFKKNFKEVNNFYYEEFYNDFLIKLDHSFEYKILNVNDAIYKWKSCLSPYNCEHDSKVKRRETNIQYGLLSFYLYFLGYSVVGYPQVLEIWKSAKETSIDVFKEETRRKYNIGDGDVPWVKRREFAEGLKLDKDETITIEIIKKVNQKIKLIGEGSYATVHSYIDPFYDRKYAIKIAKKDLDEIELKRFKIEFQQMKRLHSPYILEVYKYDEGKNSYTMELMDLSLEKYMQTNNSKLHTNTRKSLILQILKAFNLIHSKKLLHRDISVNNFLLKEYQDGSLIIKVSDFGLVKSKEHVLTSVTTDIKGHLNVSDNVLQTNGFKSYGIINETYALTLIIYYILTGKLNYDNISNDNIKNFVMKGINANGNERYQSIEELHKAVKELFVSLDKQGYR